MVAKTAPDKAEYVRDYIGVNQYILHYIYVGARTDATIEELQNKLKFPRSTVVDHLNTLERIGFINVGKDGRMKKYGYVPELLEKFKTALSGLTEAYLFALTSVREKQLKELKELEK